MYSHPRQSPSSYDIGISNSIILGNHRSRVRVYNDGVRDYGGLYESIIVGMLSGDIPLFILLNFSSDFGYYIVLPVGVNLVHIWVIEKYRQLQLIAFKRFLFH